MTTHCGYLGIDEWKDHHYSFSRKGRNSQSKSKRQRGLLWWHGIGMLSHSCWQWQKDRRWSSMVTDEFRCIEVKWCRYRLL